MASASTEFQRRIEGWLTSRGATDIHYTNGGKNVCLEFNWHGQSKSYHAARSSSDWRAADNCIRDLRHMLNFPPPVKNDGRRPRRRLDDMTKGLVPLGTFFPKPEPKPELEPPPSIPPDNHDCETAPPMNPAEIVPTQISPNPPPQTDSGECTVSLYDAGRAKLRFVVPDTIADRFPRGRVDIVVVPEGWRLTAANDFGLHLRRERGRNIIDVERAGEPELAHGLAPFGASPAAYRSDQDGITILLPTHRLPLIRKPFKQRQRHGNQIAPVAAPQPAPTPVAAAAEQTDENWIVEKLRRDWGDRARMDHNIKAVLKAIHYVERYTPLRTAREHLTGRVMFDLPTRL